MPGPFDDELTPDEEKLLRENSSLPPAEDDEENAPSADRAKEEAAPADASKPEEAPKAEDQPAAEEDEDAEVAAFLEKHRGKSPEELARIALQQTKRANKEAASGRVMRENLSAITERVKAAAAARAEAEKTAAERKTQFRERLSSDPDAATADLHDKLVDSEVAAARAAEAQARVDAAIEFGSAHIPEFDKRWPQMQSTLEEIGFAPEELDGINDGRTLVVAYLATIAANAIKAGLMDRSGTITAPQPQPVAEIVTDPRLKGPDPVKTLGSTGGRSTKGAASVEQQLADLANMPEDEFNKLDPSIIEGLLKQVA